MSETMDREFGWDDEIENDGQDFVVLPDGDYDFTVEKFERARYGGSDKIPPCNKAVVYLKIQVPDGTATIIHNLYLCTKCEGLLCAFFTAIGLRKHGERFKMDWNRVTGSKGRAHVVVDKWTGNDGQEHTNNKVKKFYEPEDTPPSKTYEAGKF